MDDSKLQLPLLYLRLLLIMSMCSIFHTLLHNIGNVSEYFSLNPTEKQTVTVSGHVCLLKMKLQYFAT